MLNGKTALITGASRGIGRAIALEFAKNGADIAVLYSGGCQQALEVCNEALSFGRKAKSYQCDVASFTQTEAVVAEVISDFGGLDILVNNAGITRDNLILQMSEDDFDRVIEVNLKGAFNMTKHTYRHFMRKKSGRIINITSVSGLMGNAGQANYSAAKAGLAALTKTTAKELASRGVTCNAIAPGFIETDMTKQMPEGALTELVKQIPLKRTGSPEDIAHLAAFLASDYASYITGEIIKVDGGLYI